MALLLARYKDDLLHRDILRYARNLQIFCIALTIFMSLCLTNYRLYQYFHLFTIFYGSDSACFIIMAKYLIMIQV